MLNTSLIIIIVSLISLTVSQGLHCDPPQQAASRSTYNPQYMIPNTNGQIILTDKFLASQRYLHNYYSTSSAKAESALIIVLKNLRSDTTGQQLIIYISHDDGLYDTVTIDLDAPITSYTVFEESISVLIYKGGQDKITTIEISSASSPTVQEVATQKDLIISNSITLSDASKNIVSDDIVSFHVDSSEYYYLVEITDLRYALLTNSGVQSQLSTLYAEIQLASGTTTTNIKCYPTTICLDMDNKILYRRSGSTTILVPVTLIAETDKTITNMFRIFRKWSVLSVTDATNSADIDLNLLVFEDATDASPDLRGTFTSFDNVEENRLEVVDSSYNFVVEYNSNLGFRVQFIYGSDKIISVKALAGGTIMAELTSTLYSWNMEDNLLFILLSDKLVHCQVVMQGLDSGTGDFSSNGYDFFLLSEAGGKLLHTRTLTLASQITTEIDDTTSLLFYLKIECICMNQGAKTFKCFYNGFCLRITHYDEVVCSQAF